MDDGSNCLCLLPSTVAVGEVPSFIVRFHASFSCLGESQSPTASIPSLRREISTGNLCDACGAPDNVAVQGRHSPMKSWAREGWA